MSGLPWDIVFERSAVERGVAVPLSQMPGVGVPVLVLELEIRGNKRFAEAALEHARLLEQAQGVQQIQRKALGVFDRVPLGVHVDVEALSGIALAADAIEARDEDAGLQQVRIGGAVAEP